MSWASEQPEKRKHGRPRVHGERCAFKEPEIWGEQHERLTFEDAKFGQVKLERWNNPHGKKDADVPFDVVRASIHLEKEKPPQPRWLAWQPADKIPAGLEIDAKLIWLAYVHRWAVEPGIRFRKQCLGWTTPHSTTRKSVTCGVG